MKKLWLILFCLLLPELLLQTPWKACEGRLGSCLTCFPDSTSENTSITSQPEPIITRVFLVITTQSDWTTLQIRKGGRLVGLTYTIIEGEDAPELSFWSDLHENMIGLNKKPNNTTLVKIEVTAILLLEGDSDVIFEIQKGDIEYTTVEIHNYNTGDPDLILTKTGYTVESNPNNAAQFTVSAKELLEGGPLPLLEYPVSTLVWAFYYPWYFKDQWYTDDALTDTPLYPYESSNPEAIEFHMKQAMASGIDGFIVSWWGKYTDTDANLKIILDIAERYSFKVSIIFESLGDGPRSEEELKRMLFDFFKDYSGDDRYYTINGKPVIFVWAANSHEPDVWEDIIAAVEEKGYEGIYIAETGDPRYLGVFDGLYLYGTVGIDDISGVYERLSLACRTYGYLDSGESYLWAGTACPGYDDRAIPGREGLVALRRDGVYYTETYEAALASSPDWLLITSFNEWWENTHIEPSVNYGFLYLDLTAQFSFTFKGVPTQKPFLLRAHELFDEGIELCNVGACEKAQSKFDSAQKVFNEIGYTEKSSQAIQYLEQCKKIAERQSEEGTEDVPEKEQIEEKQSQQEEPEGSQEKTGQDDEATLTFLLVLTGFLAAIYLRRRHNA